MKLTKYVTAMSLGLIISNTWAEPTGRIFVTNEKGNTISVINGDTHEIESSIDIGERPRGIGLSPDGSELYIAVSEENAIAVVDPKTLEVLRKFESGSDPVRSEPFCVTVTLVTSPCTLTS